MAKTKVKVEVAKKAIENIFRRSSEVDGKRFQVGKHIVIPKVVMTKDGLLLFFTKSLSEFEKWIKPESVIIDVLGLHKTNVTQLEIYENGEVRYSSEINRDANEVQKFVELLAQM